MDIRRPFSCFLIGEGTLLVQCAEILLERGHAIYGVISADEGLRSWIDQKGLLSIHPVAQPDFLETLRQHPFDYLFSIVNYLVLPEVMADLPAWAAAEPRRQAEASLYDALISLPVRAAINYHDGPLPRYAGFYATSWALMNHEASHGVTWHQMARQVDSGEIYQQALVPVSDEDTALTLNARCYEAAIASFSRLVDELEAGEAKPSAQDTAQRIYFPLLMRPAAGGVLSLQNSAQDLEAMGRALEFGPHPNPLGLPKMYLNGEFVLVGRITQVELPASGQPGEILRIDEDGLLVASGTWPVKLSELRTLDGLPFNLHQAAGRAGLHKGGRLEGLPAEWASRIDEHLPSASRHEAYWSARLKDFSPLSLSTPLLSPRKRGEDPLAARGSLPVYEQGRGGVSIGLAKYARTTPLLPLHQLSLNTLISPGKISTNDSLPVNGEGRGGVFLPVFGAYLSRLSGMLEFDMGYRSLELSQSEVGREGFFAPWLPLRIDLRPGWSLSDIQAAVQGQAEQVCAQFTYPRDLTSRQPALKENHLLPGRARWMAAFDEVESLYGYQPLPGAALVLAAGKEGARLFYDPAVFDRDSAESLARQFADFAARLEQGSGRLPFTGLSLCSQVEAQRVLVEWNDTHVDFPPDETLHTLFEAQVRRTPNAVAVLVPGGPSLTYAALNRRANQLAHVLRGMGVGPDQLVGLCVERSLEMVVGLLGILKAGGAYVPMDPAYPKERLAYMLAHSNAPVLLTQSSLLAALPEHRGKTICLDSDWDASIANQSQESPQNLNYPDNLAYVIYTSGSTGLPKGAMLTHRSICNHMHWMQSAFPLGQDDAVLQKTPFSFDASVWEFYAPLLAGGRLVMARPGGHLDAAYLCQVINEQRITILQLVPTLLKMLLFQEQFVTCTSLKRVFCGGEALPPEVVEEFYSTLPADLINLYGPTEATIDSITWTCPLGVSLHSVPIGRPVANLRAYILDQYLQPLPPASPYGLSGELYLGGAGLGRGYVGRPDLTAERFIPDPFGPPGSRLYRTGDLARYLPNGDIEFLGRVDHQVKIRGFRIELGEIEAALRSHPSIKEAVVVDRQDGPGGARLAAYLVQDAAQPPITAQDARAHLAGRLPEYMLPSAFVILDTLPLTPNGKIDRLGLPAPEFVRTGPADSFIAPRNAVEQIVVDIFQQVLGLEQVSVEDDFFELGGNSLLATQAAARLRAAFQAEISLTRLFETPRPAGLTKVLGRLSKPGGAPAILPRNTGEPAPLSFAQQRLWFLEQLDPGQPTYHVPVAVRLAGPLDAQVLERSLNEIVRRHEALRTTFGASGDSLGQDDRGLDWPVQQVALSLSVPLPVIDLSFMPKAEREPAVQRLLAGEIRPPFDLQSGPLLRFSLLRLDAAEHVLLITVHHAVFDGWSIEIFFGELSALYAAFLPEKPSPLPALPIQYSDYAAWQRSEMQGQRLDGQLAYWKKQLSGPLPVLQLPTDRPRPPVPSARGAVVRFTISPGLAKAVKTFSQQQGVTLFMTLLAAFDALLYRYTGQGDLLVGTPIANRPRPELAGLIGFFVNTLALRVQAQGDLSFQGLLERVRQAALSAYANQDLPFEQLVQALNPERDSSRQSLFQVMFVLQNAALASLQLPGLELRTEAVDTGAAMFDLVLTVEDDGQALAGVIEYSTDLFDESRVSRLAEHFQALLEGAVARPEMKLYELPLLTRGERQQLMEWNDTAQDYLRDVCIHHLFEAQARRTPQAVAVVYDEQHLTYQELDQRADQVAQILRELGVGPEVLVGLCVERSLDMPVGLLGILKAGGAYVPLDPNYPAERLAFMLEDTRLPVLLTQKRLLERLPPHACQVICIDQDLRPVITGEKPVEPSPVQADNLAYVIYTSGSTGRPKGVLVSHRNLLHSTSARLSYYHQAVSSFFLASSFAFDSSIAGIFWTLCQGGALLLSPVETITDVPALAGLLVRQKVSHLLCLPSLYALLLEELRAYPENGLKTVIVAGETCPEALLKSHAAQMPGVELFNEYGPTEGSVWCTVYQANGPLPGGVVPIGRPIPNAQVYLLDAALQPVPLGVPGELYLGGEGVARGYLNRPEQTAGRFIPDLFGKQAGRRLYRTGDLARYLPDGNLEFLGRLDNQVKVRGFRIELGEIEAALAAYPGLQESAVIAWEVSSLPGDKRLAAYYLYEGQPGPAPAGLRQHLKASLPDYMVPSAFIRMPFFPRTPNGKVDRKKLPPPDLDQPASGQAYQAPHGPVETAIAQVWGELLGLEKISRQGSFFDLGGHSLLAARAMSRLGQKLDMNLPLRLLFDFPELAGLAARIEDLRWAAAAPGPADESDREEISL